MPIAVNRWMLARERTTSSYRREPQITTLSSDPYVIIRERVISGALVDGFAQRLLRCGHATTSQAQTNTGRPTPGTDVRSLVRNHTSLDESFRYGGS